MTVHIVGAGLAGSEAAWQIARKGQKVVLHEMRPKKMTAAHKTSYFAELVCSNSFKSLDENSASGQLKKELLQLDSLIIKTAHMFKVPAGNALAIDREKFSKSIEKTLEEHPHITIKKSEVLEIPELSDLDKKGEHWIIATGPLTSDALASSLEKLCGDKKRLFFYDAIAPIINAETIAKTQGFWADRYDKGDADYFNIPLDRKQYEDFIAEVKKAPKTPLHDFEKPKYFEACLPIEVMIDRGPETLRFGPLKPVGFTDPKTGKRPHAVIQLRAENNERTMLSMVGFQTKLKWGEQKRIFSSLPSLQDAEFVRFGSIHRNTYINSPQVLNPDFSFKTNRRVHIAGQLSGVEGYLESTASGLVVSRLVVNKALGETLKTPPRDTILGALLNYVLKGPKSGNFSPMNVNMGILPPLEEKNKIPKAKKKERLIKRAQNEFSSYMASL